MNVKDKKILLGFLVVFAFLFGATAEDEFDTQIPQDPSKFHIFVLMGQSNMEGGQVYEGMDTEPHPRVLKLNSWGSWEVAVDPITNNYESAVGPGLAFAKALAEENKDITIGLIPAADGGTAIAKWIKGSENYNYAIGAAQDARSLGVVKGVLWHQGEHDTFFYYTIEAYYDNLRTLIDDIRIDLNERDLPFITGGFTAREFEADEGGFDHVQSSIQYTANTYYKTGYARSTGAPFYKEDPLHFNSVGQRIMGQRYFEEYLRLNGYWTEKAKTLLDDEAILDETGWKYHPSIGLYFDANYPYIKQAQLGWLKVSAYSDMTMRLDSPLFGQVRNMKDAIDDGFYAYRENADLEITARGMTYFVRAQADENQDLVIFNMKTKSWHRTIDDSTDFRTVEDYYLVAKDQFYQTQKNSVDMVNINNTRGFWSDATQKLEEARMHRYYTIQYANEMIRFAQENVEESRVDYWKDLAQDLIDRIDEVFSNIQVKYQEHTKRKLTPSIPVE